MTDDEAQEVQTAVRDYLNGPHGQGFDIGNPQHFEQLVTYVKQYVDFAEDALRIVIAMCVLNLGAPDIPPAAMRHHLLAIVRRYVPQEETRTIRVMEFAIAYGSERWLEGQENHVGWERPWEGAGRALVRAIEPAVAQANRWLANHVVGFPQGRHLPQIEGFPQSTDVWSDASLLKSRLTQPQTLLEVSKDEELEITSTDGGTEFKAYGPGYLKLVSPGAKAVWTIVDRSTALRLPDGRTIALPTGAKVIITARDNDAIIRVAVNGQNRSVQLKGGKGANIRGPATLAIWECTCGTTQCAQRHRLEAWEPTRIDLWSFLASAVKGPQATIQAGSFVAGMYFPLLAQEGF
jgi:hypothetical protein